MGELDDLIRHYDRMSDNRLLAIALHEAADLRPEAVQILRQELRKRNLESQLSPAIESQLSPLDPQQIDSLVRRFRALACPACSASNLPLNAFSVSRATSILIVTRYQRQLIVGCPACIVDAANRADAHTALCGWWGIPWGPIRSIQALLHNAAVRRAAKQQQVPSKELI